MKSVTKLTAALAVAGAALCAGAETYRLKPDCAGINTGANSFSDPTCWQIDGGDATTYPQAVDTIEMGDYDIKNSRADRTHVGKIALDNNYTVTDFVKDYNNLHLYKSENASGLVSLNITGTLGGSSYQHYFIYEGASLVAAVGSTIYGSRWDTSSSTFNLENGGSASIYGHINSRHIEWTIKSGASLTFDPASYENFTSSEITKNAGDAFNVKDGGSLIFTHGLAVSGGNSYYANSITQSGGTVTFGGGFTSAATGWTYTWSAGTLNITENATFASNIALTIPESSSVTLDVASGKTFSAANFTADSTATITKTGGGVFTLPTTSASIAVNGGGIGLGAATYDLSAVTFEAEAGTTVNLTAMGVRINAADASIANATFVATIPATAGTSVLYSTNPEILKYAKADLDSSVPAGFDLVISGETLSVEAETSGSFTVAGDILDPLNWGGNIPNDGDVSIDGVIASYNSGDLPDWDSIEVKNGATLCINADLALPKIILNKNATLKIANNATVTFSSVGDLAGTVATSPELVVPSLVIESGATLNVPGGMKFSNVDISLAGKIAVTSVGTLTIGYAANGESSYIGFNSNGGSIFLSHGSDYDVSRLGICCPEAGGTVHVVNNGKILFKDMPSVGTHFKEIHYSSGFHIGVGNPASERFEVVFSNTKWGTNGNLYVAGGATFILQDGSSFQNTEEYGYYNRHFNVTEAGQIVVGTQSELIINALGNYGSNESIISSDTVGHSAIVVRDGGVYDNYRTVGNGNAVYEFSGGFYRVYLPSIHKDSYNSENILFNGAKAVSVGSDSTLTFSTRNGDLFNDNSNDRVVTLADVPITGGGSIALDNANANDFGVIVTSGNNTATGTASVVAPGEGEGDTTLYFANGANWAGTVVSGNVKLTNVVDGNETASTATFGELNLASGTEFKIRVWKSNGVIASHDTLNVGSYDNNGGKIVLVAMDEDLKPGDSFVLGAVGSNSEVPALTGRWGASIEDGDNDTKVLKIGYASGLTVILR